MRQAAAAAGRAWGWGFVAVVIGCIGVLAANVVLGELRSGNKWSIGYGIAATVVLVVVALLGLRRRMPRLASRLRLGRAQIWLRLHLYGGTLFLLLLLMHSGIARPVGTLTTWLWLLSLWTVVSGFAGLALERWIPRVLTSGLATEVLDDRIPELVADVRQRADALVAESGDAIKALYEGELASAFEQPRLRPIYFVDVTGGIRGPLRVFNYLSGLLPPEEESRLDQLEALYRTKLELDAHFTLQRPLRWWLWAHVPTSVVLVALVAVHIAAALYY